MPRFLVQQVQKRLSREFYRCWGTRLDSSGAEVEFVPVDSFEDSSGEVCLDFEVEIQGAPGLKPQILDGTALHFWTQGRPGLAEDGLELLSVTKLPSGIGMRFQVT